MDRSSSALDIPTRGQTPETLRVAFDMVSDVVFFAACHSLRLVYVNQSACSNLAYSRTDLLDMCVDDLVPEAGNGELAEAINRVARTDIPDASVRSVYRRSDGSEFAVGVSLRRIDTGDEGFLVVVASHARASGQPASRDSDSVPHDALTDLPSRAGLERRLEWEARRAGKSGGRYGVLFIDIDRFKRVNDTMGHLIGDHVLRTVAQRLVGCLRPTDIAVRFGGDEFVAIVTDVRCVEDVVQVARRIRRTMGQAIEAAGSRVSVTASIGIAMGGANGSTDALRLLHQADRAMYQAKARGRQGHYAVYCPCEDRDVPATEGAALDVVPVSQPSHSSYAPRLPR